MFDGPAVAAPAPQRPRGALRQVLDIFAPVRFKRSGMPFEEVVA